MITQEQLKQADRVSRNMHEWHKKANEKVKAVVTQWGKNTINYNNLYTRVNSTYSNDMYIEVTIPSEFGASFTIYIAENKGIGFNHGAIGTYSIKTHPRQRDIIMLYGKLLEHHDKFESDLLKVHKELTKEKIKLEIEFQNFKTQNPKVMAAYFESELFQKRKEQEQKESY